MVESKKFVAPLLAIAALLLPAHFSGQSASQPEPAQVFGYTDFREEAKVEAQFLAVPDAKLAGEHLKILTAAPHLASSIEDRKTAEYVAKKFKAAGLETEIIPYRVLMNQPKVVRVEAFGAGGLQLMSGPTREHVEGDPFQDDPRVVMAFNGSSGSGDVTGDAVYANYGRIEDFDELAKQKVDLHGKIVVVRYGKNFRGVKVALAEQRGAAGVLIYSDPADDGITMGESYPNGPWRPDTGVQRGSVQLIFKYPGDPETPGVASTLELPDSARQSPYGNEPHIISIPLSPHDARPILQALQGNDAPQSWQGGLNFRYHLGKPGVVKVHLVSQQDYQRRVIWDVIGTVAGSESPNERVIVGNHRDAWVYGAVDPSSGTAAMLEAVHGVGALLKQGWKPKRTLVFASWDAEEEGLIGSTEWVEGHASELERTVAYFNTDVAASGPDFAASAVPSLRQFVREVTRSVASPVSGTVYQQWKITSAGKPSARDADETSDEVHLGSLGSGSDFTPFLQHAGVPSTDITSDGPYGVYHSVFDNYSWYTMNADPHFVYLQQMARVLGLEAVRMADAEVLPYDYVSYARAIDSYLAAAKKKAEAAGVSGLDFAPTQAAAAHFAAAAERVHRLQLAPVGDRVKLNGALRQAESAFLNQNGLPGRSWYRHTIFAPGENTGYAAVAIPGVNEAIDAKDRERAAQQLRVLALSLTQAAQTLEAAK